MKILFLCFYKILSSHVCAFQLNKQAQQNLYFLQQKFRAKHFLLFSQNSITIFAPFDCVRKPPPRISDSSLT